MNKPVAVICLVALIACPALAADDVQFDRDIRPILSDKCFHCHGPDSRNRKAKLRLDLMEQALGERPGSDGITPFKPGDLENSEAWYLIHSDDPEERMPPAKAKKPLTKKEIGLLKRWIEQGAKWSRHWAFVAPAKSPSPKLKTAGWVRNEIDSFILARLEQEGLKPQQEADRNTLVRRLTLDLTGLPPTPAEVEAFLRDKSPNAYEKLVDRVLASKHYGERMAVTWLDAARYGDTSVFHADGPRDMWAWRDGVVRAYNNNTPFDAFSTAQLAGDLIPNASIDQRVASGFNRNNGTTDEGGVIAEEYRVEYAVDRVKTTSMVWLGLTMECGQCHEHKYDPISQDDYYGFYAFFNASSDRGMQTRRGNADPKLSLPDPEKEKQIPAVQAEIAQVEKKIKAHEASIESAFNTWLAKKEAEVKSGNVKTLMPTNPIAHLTFDKAERKNQFANLADPKHKAPLRGGKPQLVKARLNSGLKLNGRMHVDLGKVGDFERTDKFSYGGWVHTDGNPNGAFIARMDNRNKHRGYDILFQNGAVTVHIINAWDQNAIKVRTKKTLKPKTWNHVFATYDGSSKAAGIRIYVNGEKWDWVIERDKLSGTIRTDKPLWVGSRNPDSKLKGTVDDIRVYNRELSQAEVQALAQSNPITPILAVAADKRSKAQTDTLRQYYLHNEDKAYQGLVKQREQLKAKEVDLRKPITTVMVMADMAKPRDTFILNRGAYDQPTKTKVQPGTPLALPPMAEDMPRNRLGLAQWLFQKEHPLTARVAVNRYWLMLFGTGLVKSPEDFGSQGEFPSHPKLLNWLAVDFRENKWNVKRMIKTIVMSATYRQDSRCTDEVLERDPDNRLLARGPRFRLQSEFVRDNALAISGLLLKDKMGGPGVKPYQPPGLWAEVGLGGNPKFRQDKGEALYRRSLYTYWKRSAPPPNQQIFDAPTREKCTIQRPRTNTPLQALATMNDVQFVEAARHFAGRLMKEGGKSPAERVAYAYTLATARKPNANEKRIVEGVYRDSLKHYRSNAEAAKKLLSNGESKRDESLDVAEHAAWTIVASTVLNLDETLTRE